MEKLFNVWSVTAGVVGGIAISALGEWDAVLKVLLVMIVLDYLTGVIKAVYTKQLSSETGFKGLLKKITILIVVCVANKMQQLTGDTAAIREMVIVFYIANEGISLLENASEFIPLPGRLKDVLLQLRDKEENI